MDGPKLVILNGKIIILSDYSKQYNLAVAKCLLLKTVNLDIHLE